MSPCLVARKRAREIPAGATAAVSHGLSYDAWVGDRSRSLENRGNFPSDAKIVWRSVKQEILKDPEREWQYRFDCRYSESFFSKHPVHRPQRKNSTIVMADFFNCGFARAAVKSCTTDLSGKNHTLTDKRRAERLDLFKSQFSFTADEISANPHLETFGKATKCQHTFDRNCSNLMKVFSRTSPGRAKQQNAFMAQFKPEPWRKLPRMQHLSHNVTHCYACAHKYPALHTAFPVRATTTPKNTVSPMAFKLAGKIPNTKDANKRAAAHKTAESIFKEITNKMNEYRETFGQDITEQWLNQSCAGLQLTPTRAERLKARKEIEKKAK